MGRTQPTAQQQARAKQSAVPMETDNDPLLNSMQANAYNRMRMGQSIQGATAGQYAPHRQNIIGKAVHGLEDFFKGKSASGMKPAPKETLQTVMETPEQFEAHNQATAAKAKKLLGGQ